MTKHSAAADAELTAAHAPARTLFELQPAETIIMSVRPAIVRQLIAPYWWCAVLAGLLVLLHAALPPGVVPFSNLLLPIAPVIAILPPARHLDHWLRRRYVLTDRRVLSLHEPYVLAELPLSAVRRVEIEATRPQATLNVGDVVFAAERVSDVRWQGVPDAAHLRQAARDVIRRYARGALED